MTRNSELIPEGGVSRPGSTELNCVSVCVCVCVCTNLRSQDWRRLETSGFLEDNRLVLAFWMFFRFLKLDHGKALVEGTVGQSTSSMAAILLQPSLEEVLREPQSVRLNCV